MSRRHALNHPWMYRAGMRLVSLLPRAVNRWGARRIADWNYLRLSESRRAVEENLAPLFPDPAERRRAALRLFRNYAENLAEFAAFFISPRAAARAPAAFAEASGYEHLEAALALGKGVVLVTAHLGFWELGGLYFLHRGLPVSVLTLEDPDPGVHQERTRIRSSLGIETITVGRDPWESLAVARALRRNGLAAMLVDRYEGADAVPVELFGRIARFAPGPVLYARMTGAAVIPAFVVRLGGGRYRGVVSPPVPMEFTRDRAADLRRNTQAIARTVEAAVAAYPDQWYNFEVIWRDA